MYNNGDNANYGRGRRTNQKQKHILFAAMAMNRKILECRSGESNTRRARKRVWNNLVVQLNMAGPKKDIVQWRKCWTDLRLNMRKKWDKAQNSNYHLTEYERRIITSCGMIDYGDKFYESAEETSAEDVSSFLTFLDEVKDDLKEEEPHPKYFEHNEEDYSNQDSQYNVDVDSCERIICEPEEISVKEEFEEEPTKLEEFREQEYHKEQDGDGFEDFEEEEYKGEETRCDEELKEDQEPTTDKEFTEHSVECISDDEPVIVIEDDVKSENHFIPSPSYEQSYTPHETVVVEPEKEKSPSPEPTSTPILPLPMPNINLSSNPSQELQKATIIAIRKMHRSLLKESKKQTSLLRRLVRGLERDNT